MCSGGAMGSEVLMESAVSYRSERYGEPAVYGVSGSDSDPGSDSDSDPDPDPDGYEEPS
jgi:hypothetical protein